MIGGGPRTPPPGRQGNGLLSRDTATSRDTASPVRLSSLDGGGLVGPLRVVSISHQGVADPPGDVASILVRFSAPVAPDSPDPALSPPIPGSWVRASPTLLEFRPISGYVVTTAELLTIPPGERGTGGAKLATAVEERFVPPPSNVLRLQELLAELGYLPVTFTSSNPVDETRTAELSSFSSPPSGRFAWRFAGEPLSLRALWHPGHYGVITEGAVMAFESRNAMIVGRAFTPAVMDAVADAKLAGLIDPRPYSYVFVSEARPESLTLYLGGQIVMRSLANTGLDNATPIGTWPVYLRNPIQTLVGTYPDGQPYDIPGVRDINYFNGSFAVHAFVRARYGFPQSAGCVELPPVEAAEVWNDIGYGTLVTISRDTVSAAS